jgi:prepilin-type N-terminal cleavage/methylation domain-containing protein/prepilin-type processing-associated H-X9-DG protein
MQKPASVSPEPSSLERFLWSEDTDRPLLPRSPHGFSLIELLVVISIIALLIGILLPALGAAVGSARNIKCQANQRSLAQGVHLHATDYDGFHQDVNSLAPASVVDANGRWTGDVRPNGRYNSGLRYGPVSRLGGGSNRMTRLLGPSYRGEQSLDGNSNNEAYWAVRYDAYVMDSVPHRPRGTLPTVRLGRGELPPGQDRPIDFSMDFVDIGEDPERFVLQAWELSQCPEASYMAINYRLGLPFEPYGLYSSYSFNGFIPERSPYPGVRIPPYAFFDDHYLPRRLSSINFNIIMFQDGSEPFLEGNGDMLNRLDQGRPEDDTSVWIPEYFRHAGQNNAAMIDGSVETFKGQFPERGYAPYAGYDPLAPNGGG